LEKRRGRLRALGAELPKIGAPVSASALRVGPTGLRMGPVVGADLADKIAPDRLTFPRGERQDGTLRLRVSSAFAPEAQHRTPQLIERINGFFGYRAIARVVLVQGPLPRSGPPAVRGRGRWPHRSARRLTTAWPVSRIRPCATRCAASARR